jgi:hypothetical protein
VRLGENHFSTGETLIKCKSATSFSLLPQAYRGRGPWMKTTVLTYRTFTPPPPLFRRIPVRTSFPPPPTGSTGFESPCSRGGFTRLSVTSPKMRTGIGFGNWYKRRHLRSIFYSTGYILCFAVPGRYIYNLLEYILERNFSVNYL